MTLEDILVGFATKALKVDAAKVRQLLYKLGDDGSATDQISENALAELLNLDKTRIDGLRS
jgi:hypothetical protein